MPYGFIEESITSLAADGVFPVTASAWAGLAPEKPAAEPKIDGADAPAADPQPVIKNQKRMNG